MPWPIFVGHSGMNKAMVFPGAFGSLLRFELLYVPSADNCLREIPVGSQINKPLYCCVFICAE